MFAENQKISVRQLEAMLLLDFFGTAVLFLPAELAQTAGNNSWMVAALWGVAAALTAALLMTLGRKNPSYTAVEWYRTSFGKVVGTVLALGLAGKLLFDGAMELRIFTEIVSRSMLPKTPLWLLMAVFILLCVMAAAQGIECRGRAAEILFFLVFIPLAVILIAVAITADYGRILPLSLPQGKEVWQSGKFISPLFQGLTFLLLIYPALEKPKGAGRRVFITCLVGAVVFSGLVLLCLAVFGVGVLSEKMLPTLQMMERVSFTGIFLSRQDLLLLWFWISSAFLFVSASLFFGSFLFVRLLGKGREKGSKWLFLWCPLLFLVAMLPHDLAAAYQWRLAVLPWMNGFFLLLIPLALLAIQAIKRRVRE